MAVSGNKIIELQTMSIVQGWSMVTKMRSYKLCYSCKIGMVSYHVQFDPLWLDICILHRAESYKVNGTGFVAAGYRYKVISIQVNDYRVRV